MNKDKIKANIISSLVPINVIKDYFADELELTREQDIRKFFQEWLMQEPSQIETWWKEVIDTIWQFDYGRGRWEVFFVNYKQHIHTDYSPIDIIEVEGEKFSDIKKWVATLLNYLIETETKFEFLLQHINITIWINGKRGAYSLDINYEDYPHLNTTKQLISIFKSVSLEDRDKAKELLEEWNK